MSTGGHTWLPRVFKQADQRVNECVTDGPSRECFASRKPADRNQPRVPHRREVGNVDHGNRQIEWHREFGNGHKLAGTRLEIGQVNATSRRGSETRLNSSANSSKFCSAVEPFF